MVVGAKTEMKEHAREHRGRGCGAAVDARVVRAVKNLPAPPQKVPSPSKIRNFGGGAVLSAASACFTGPPAAA